ncbi:MAG: bifunctional phosphopantothenoylcysteine decarboxylase/phosphopantothenate--cysteine ligase CoaBC [Solirubrobacterales bacterium]
MARILLGVSGGIAAYKAVEFARLATRAGHSIRVLMTASSRRFVGAETFEGITGAPVLSSEFEEDPMSGRFPGEEPGAHEPIGHLEIAERADAYLVAPASANTVAKVAAGQADSMLTTSFLACPSPRLVAPAMNDRMLADPATRANLDLLRSRGVEVIDPDTGPLASRGEYGKGRLPDPERLLAAVERAIAGRGRDLEGLSVLVTAGGTREPIDGVRYIGNRSSGRMGRALATAAVRRGAEVTLIEANPRDPAPAGVAYRSVETTAEMGEALDRACGGCDVLLMAAAPADFRPIEPTEGKLRRGGGRSGISLEPTEDLLASVASRRRPEQTVVGFAAEWGEDGEERAQTKLREKGADLIVLNDVSDPAIGFDSAENEVTLVSEQGNHHLEKAAKSEIADSILDRVLSTRSDLVDR